MAFRYFPGTSQEWLESQLSKILDEQASGKVLTSVSAGEVNTSSILQSSTFERRNQILWDLSQLDPATYPPADVLMPNRTSIGFIGINGSPGYTG